MQITSGYSYIPVSDLKHCAEWYTEHLGLKVFYEDRLFIELRSESGVRIMLITNENGITSHMKYRSGDQASHGFTVTDINTAYQHFVENGIKVGKLSEYGGVSFKFYDPDGNALELWSDYPKE